MTNETSTQFFKVLFSNPTPTVFLTEIEQTHAHTTKEMSKQLIMIFGEAIVRMVPL